MRYQAAETASAVQVFETGRTVNVVVLNIATDGALSTTVGTATESVIQSGVYVWDTDDLVTSLAAYTELMVRFTDSTSGLVKYTKLVVHGYIEDLDATVSSRATQTSLDALNTVLIALDVFLQGGRSIDFVGSDVLGWQRVERNTSDVEVARYNLFDQDGNRITGTVSAFILGLNMIARETKI